jgi:UDP-GlcNAc3NAcA epimerase
MSAVRLVCIVGARPQFIKQAAISRALARRALHGDEKIHEVLVHTGQHYDYEMSAVFFAELDLPEPDHHLDVGSGSHADQTALMLQRIEDVLEQEEPDLVLVHGDTNSTLAGALAAAKLHVPVAHVEAGLRSFNRRMPEEINRIVTDHLSDILFTPSPVATANLEREGIVQNVVQCGDVMFDVLSWQLEMTAKRDVEVGHAIGPYALVTIHRAENTDDAERLSSIALALEKLAREMRVVFPMHPRTRKVTEEAGTTLSGVEVIAPLSYAEMIALQRSATVMITDSGGVQKEAYWLQVPCVTVRDETEWLETVESGWNVVVGANTAAIFDAATSTSKPSSPVSAYGHGDTADRILDEILRRHTQGAS